MKNEEVYSKLLAEHFADQRPTASRPDPTSAAATPLTIAQLVVEYDDYASRVFVRDGERTDERYKAFVEPLVLLYGSKRTDRFGTLKLKAVRELLIQRGSLRTAEFDGVGNLIKPGTPLCREYVNNVIKALLRMFRWAASEEKVPASLCQALATVEGLKMGRDRRLREPAKVRPAPFTAERFFELFAKEEGIIFCEQEFQIGWMNTGEVRGVKVPRFLQHSGINLRCAGCDFLGAEVRCFGDLKKFHCHVLRN